MTAQHKSESPWLTIVGVGEDGWDALSPAARRAIESAEILYGGLRHLSLVPKTCATRIPWPSPMAPAIDQILIQLRGSKVTVLASGDPMLHGVGVTLTRHLDSSEFRVIPQVSAFSLACARLGWPIADTTLISLVNRSPEQILRQLYPNQRLILYSENGATPATVARLLTQSGFGSSTMHVFENLASPNERHTTTTAATWPSDPVANLNLIAIHVPHSSTASPSMSGSLAPGLPDEAFETDGQLTKREVRAITLARLAPFPGQLLWDVGAGTGTIAIEWMRQHPACSAIAFEVREDRAAHIRANALKLGVPTLKIVVGTALETSANQPSPDAIFLGGDVANPALFDACWQALRAGGKLVANAVTLDGEAALIARRALLGGDLARIAIARAEPLGDSHMWRSLAPITQWTVTKP